VETKLNWTSSVTYNVNKWFRQTWQSSVNQSSQIEEGFSSYHQLGGTLTAVVGQWASRVLFKGQDPFGLGRWSYITLRGKGGKLVTFISAYRVSQKHSSSVGMKTAYMQKYRAIKAKYLQHQHTSNPSPQRQIILDLQAWIQHLQENNHQIVLNIDYNDDFYLADSSILPLQFNPNSFMVNSAHNGSLCTLTTTCGLVDILALQHSSRPFPPTYIWGKKRIDYIFISASLQDSVTRPGILPYNA
jgi:hypothetical protein